MSQPCVSDSQSGQHDLLPPAESSRPPGPRVWFYFVTMSTFCILGPVVLLQASDQTPNLRFDVRLPDCSRPAPGQAESIFGQFVNFFISLDPNMTWDPEKCYFLPVRGESVDFFREQSYSRIRVFKPAEGFQTGERVS